MAQQAVSASTPQEAQEGLASFKGETMTDVRKVEGLSRANISNDGRTITATFALNTSEPVILSFPTEALGTILQDLAGVLHKAYQKSDLATQIVQSAGSVVRTRAAVTTDGEMVVLGFKMNNGLEYHFTLVAKDATAFAREIAEEAQKESRPPSHH